MFHALRKRGIPEHYFSVWYFGNSQKLLTTNQFLVSTILFTNINISFFNLRFDRFSIIAKKVNQIRNNVVCVVARLVFVFYCALTTGLCNAFRSFTNKYKSEFYSPYFQTVISCDYGQKDEPMTRLRVFGATKMGNIRYFCSQKKMMSGANLSLRH